MDCEMNDLNQEAVDEVLEEEQRQRAIQILNNTKRQFVSDCKRGLVTSSKEVPKLKDDTIGYSRLTWRLKKKWCAGGKCWFYGIQYKWFDIFGLGIWTYITKGKVKSIKIKDETMHTDSVCATRLAIGDPTFECDVIWFTDQSLATAFIEVIEAHQRETLVNAYLQKHPENIYL